MALYAAWNLQKGGGAIGAQKTAYWSEWICTLVQAQGLAGDRAELLILQDVPTLAPEHPLSPHTILRPAPYGYYRAKLILDFVFIAGKDFIVF